MSTTGYSFSIEETLQKWGRDEITGANADDISGDQLSGGHQRPALVSQDSSCDLETMAKCGHRRDSPLFFEETQHRIHKQERKRDDKICVFVKQE